MREEREMIRLRKINDCYVKRFDESDFDYFDKDHNQVRVLEEGLLGSGQAVFAIMKGEGDDAREVVEILPKGSKTLFVESDVPFKSGDIVVYRFKETGDRAAIVGEDNGQSIHALVSAPIYNMEEDALEGWVITEPMYVREALEADVEAMKTALRIKGGEEMVDRYFNPAPKYEFKPFDKVLVRDDETHPWIPGIFAYYDKDEDREGYPYRVIPCDDTSRFRYCVPYEGNEDLAGTTNNVK